MILSALAGYYDRLLAEGDVAEPGFERKEIPFVIVLDEAGAVKGVRDTREGEGKKKTARAFLVPQGVKKAAGIRANLLWDTCNYVLGHLPDNPQRGLQQREVFAANIRETFADVDDAGIQAVLAFLQNSAPNQFSADPDWAEMLESKANVTFKLAEDECLICQREAVRARIRESLKQGDGPRRQCLITGEEDVPARLHTAIKGVWGAQSSGANIVSFNLDAFCSQGKKQGVNAPVGSRAEFAYTTALNTLLYKGSRQRMQVGDASTVFWARDGHRLENQFADLFAEPVKEMGDERIEQIRSLLSAVQSGVYPVEDDQPFYVLGLAPNAARIAVRFWYEGTVREIKEKICLHFEDIAIVHASHDPEYLSLFRLLVCTATEGKSENIPPNVAGDTMQAILRGTPYPRTLLAAVVRRIRAEQSKRNSDGRVKQNVTYARAALIKGILVRNARIYHSNNKEVGVSLDRENDNIGYRLGRLFAVLERAQQAALGDVNATIRDRFYGAASATPVTVFPRLIKLKNHHLTKLDNRGQAVNLEKEIGEIIGAINGFPTHLSLDDQGRFAVGYYHQRQDYFTKHNHGGEE